MTQTNFTTDGNLPDGTVAVVVVAAGSGERLGAGMPKALVELDGKTLLEYSVERIAGLARPVLLVVVAPDSHCDQIRAAGERWAQQHPQLVGVAVVPGGPTRHESVGAGLGVVPDSVAYVLVHDCARALTPTSLFDEVVVALADGALAVIPGMEVVDTIKQVAPGVDETHVSATVDRSTLRAIQTPQGFLRETLIELHRTAGNQPTDDAGLAEAAGVPVVVVAGVPDAFKITTPRDLEYARFVLRAGTVQ